MPELTWIGKDKVVNHHHDVPFRILEKQYSFGEENSGNKIIHGDNLAALKSLLPEYEGRVKCIYIDPPYNTGTGTKAVAGLGGRFDYYTIGGPLFLADNNLNEDIGVLEMRKYIAFSENIAAENQHADPAEYLLGIQDGMSYYFYYERDRSTTLDLGFLSGLETRPKRMLIYADRCLLNKEQLNEFGITFKKIPRDITRFGDHDGKPVNGLGIIGMPATA